MDGPEATPRLGGGPRARPLPEIGVFEASCIATAPPSAAFVDVGVATLTKRWPLDGPGSEEAEPLLVRELGGADGPGSGGAPLATEASLGLDADAWPPAGLLQVAAP